MTKNLYEYKVKVYTFRDVCKIEVCLNEIAADGWRLIAVENCQNPYGEHRYYFERLKEGDKNETQKTKI
jgi:hypothetical protein